MRPRQLFALIQPRPELHQWSTNASSSILGSPSTLDSETVRLSLSMRFMAAQDSALDKFAVEPRPPPPHDSGLQPVTIIIERKNLMEACFGSKLGAMIGVKCSEIETEQANTSAGFVAAFTNELRCSVDDAGPATKYQHNIPSSVSLQSNCRLRSAEYGKELPDRRLAESQCVSAASASLKPVMSFVPLDTLLSREPHPSPPLSTSLPLPASPSIGAVMPSESHFIPLVPSLSRHRCDDTTNDEDFICIEGGIFGWTRLRNEKLEWYDILSLDSYME